MSTQHDDVENEESGDEEESVSNSSEDSSGSDEEISESEEEDENEEKDVIRINTQDTFASGDKSVPGKLSVAVKPGTERNLVNQPFDEALDLSESESNFSDPRGSPIHKDGNELKNLPFDEAVELSGSVQDIPSPDKKSNEKNPGLSTATKASIGAITPSLASKLDNENEVTKNKPFDEEVDLSDSGDSIDTNGAPSPKALKNKNTVNTIPESTIQSVKKSDSITATGLTSDKPNVAVSKPAKSNIGIENNSSVTTTGSQKATPTQKLAKKDSSSSSSGSDSPSSGSEDEDDDDDEQQESEPASPVRRPSRTTPMTTTATPSDTISSNSIQQNPTSILPSAGRYNENEYTNLKVSGEIRELFQYIGRFKAQEIELETKLKCFIPEYIPAVGDMDAFLKIPRPDGEKDNLGLKVLDEPTLAQSDATVLDLQLRAQSKKKQGDIVVRSLEQAEKNPKEIDKWIKSIADLHRSKPPPQVHYTKPMPDIETLMQVWPEEFEQELNKQSSTHGKINDQASILPTADMDMSLEHYIRIICAILDIPVHKNLYESLHVIFTLYLEFSTNQHFMNYDDQNVNAPPPFNSNINEVTGKNENIESKISY